MRLGHLIACICSLTAPFTATLSAAADTDTVRGVQYDINDLRLMAGFLPTHNTAGGGNYDWNHNYRLAVEWMRAPIALSEMGGFVWGGDIALNNGHASQPNHSTSYTGLMADILPGYAYRVAQVPYLHIEASIVFGLGLDRYKDSIGGSPNPFTYEYGLRAAGYWTFDNLWQAGLDLRYLMTQAKPNFGGSIGSQTFKTKGLAILFAGGKRF